MRLGLSKFLAKTLGVGQFFPGIPPWRLLHFESAPPVASQTD
ncbi:hypothetical protein RRSWK_05019 [Rhodopirellula sp. SWK7]|nr:hypothetical protein RRSWK_05019 [Rhodopirellula sp. SWK7]